MSLLPKLRRGYERARVTSISRAVRDQHLTYLSLRKLSHIEACIRQLDREAIPGDCLEAGVALGGSAIVIATLMARSRRFTGYDVFGMIPAPGDQDDDKSHNRYEQIRSGESNGIGGDQYYGYRSDLYRDVVDAFVGNGLAVDGDRITLTRGLFEDTLDLSGQRIAFAHIDCDWYEPVRLCLQRIFEALTPGGFIVADDYLDYGGCRRAVDQFLARHPEMQVVSQRENLVMRRAPS